MHFCESLPTLEEIYETNKFTSYPQPLEEASLPSNLNSKYHRVTDFQKLKIEKNFNIFHANANGLESKFHTLHTFLNGAVSAMDVIAITETSENKDHSFIKNISMDGFKLYHSPSLYHSLDNCGCAGDADFRIKFLFVSVRVLSYNSSLSKLCILAVLQHYHTHPFGLLSFLGLVSSPYETTSVSQSV